LLLLFDSGEMFDEGERVRQYLTDVATQTTIYHLSSGCRYSLLVYITDHRKLYDSAI
jgi:hypothetical protein